MKKEKLRRKIDGQLTVKFDNFTGMVHFYFAAEKIGEKSIKECEEQYPQYVWWEVEKNPYTTFIL